MTLASLPNWVNGVVTVQARTGDGGSLIASRLIDGSTGQGDTFDNFEAPADQGISFFKLR